MTMMEAAKSCFSNFATFSGRARRAEYWKFSLFNILMDIGLAVAGVLFSALSRGLSGVAIAWTLIGIYDVAVILPGIAVSVRRLHDIGKSGACLFFLLLPVVGEILLLVWTFQGGQYGDNQYGPDPKKAAPSGGYGYGGYDSGRGGGTVVRSGSSAGTYRQEKPRRERDYGRRQRNERVSRSEVDSFLSPEMWILIGAVAVVVVLLVAILAGGGGSGRGGSSRTSGRRGSRGYGTEGRTIAYASEEPADYRAVGISGNTSNGGSTEGNAHVHSWSPATCERAAMCSLCGEQRGVALGHDWEPATYDHPRRCRVCGATEGDPLQSISTETATTAAPVIVSSGQKPKLSEKSTVDLITEDRSNSKYVSVSVAHSPSLSACESVVKKLRNAGYNAFIYEIPGKGGYGIHIGLYGSVDDAEIMAQYLHEQPAVQGAKLDHAYSVNAYMPSGMATLYSSPWY